ncbi:MAG: inositol monophosphatase family protein [Actinomycetota bacterium]
MELTPSDLRMLGEVAVDAANEAGRLISSARPLEVRHKPGATPASQVVTEVDLQAEAAIVKRLRPTIERFDLGLLTEERDDDRSRLEKAYFWCVDPLDGTLPFIEGRPGSAVSIALVDHDGTPAVGVVHDPHDGTTWHAAVGAGVERNGVAWTPPVAGSSLSVFADRSLLDGDAADRFRAAIAVTASELGLDGVDWHVGAGAVMNACGVLTSPRACYVKAPVERGGGSLWDFAATACLFAEAGAAATDIVGRALDLNRADATGMNHRGVCFASDAVLSAELRRRLGS